MISTENIQHLHPAKTLCISGSAQMIEALQAKGVSFEVDKAELDSCLPPLRPKTEGRTWPNSETLITFYRKSGVTIIRHDPTPAIAATALAGGRITYKVTIHLHANGANIHLNLIAKKPTHRVIRDQPADILKKNALRIGGDNNCESWMFIPIQ